MCPCADNVWGLKPIAEAEALRSDPWWVGERCVGGEAVRVSGGGSYASENVGISNEKTGENPVRRKPKVS